MTISDEIEWRKKNNLIPYFIKRKVTIGTNWVILSSGKERYLQSGIRAKTLEGIFPTLKDSSLFLISVDAWLGAADEVTLKHSSCSFNAQHCSLLFRNAHGGVGVIAMQLHYTLADTLKTLK